MMGGMGMGAMGGGMPGMGPMGGMMMQQQMQGAGMHGDGGGGGGNNAIHSVMDGALPLYLEDVNWSERLDCKLAAALLLFVLSSKTWKKSVGNAKDASFVSPSSSVVKNSIASSSALFVVIFANYNSYRVRIRARRI